MAIKPRVHFGKDVPDDMRAVVRWATAGFARLCGVKRKVAVHVKHVQTLVMEETGKAVKGVCIFNPRPDVVTRIHLAALAATVRYDEELGVLEHVDDKKRIDVLAELAFVTVHELVHFDWECKGIRVHQEGRVDYRAMKLLEKMCAAGDFPFGEGA